MKTGTQSAIETAIAVQVSDHQGRDALLRGNGIDAETRIRRQFVNLTLAGQPDFLREIGLAGLIIENVDLRTGVVDDDDVVEFVSIDIRDAKLADLAVDGKNFGTVEPEGIGVLGVAGANQKRGGGKTEGETGKSFG